MVERGDSDGAPALAGSQRGRRHCDWHRRGGGPRRGDRRRVGGRGSGGVKTNVPPSRSLTGQLEQPERVFEMPVFDTYSKRKRRQESQGKQELYRYDLPAPLRHQVIHIWSTAIGAFHGRQNDLSTTIWKTIHDLTARELGLPYLGQYSFQDIDDQCKYFLLMAETDNALDLIELSFRIIDRAVRQYEEYQRRSTGITQGPDDAIDELNQRFREHAVGYQYLEGKIVRIDSLYLHDQVTLPALQLLHESGFQGVSEEFLRAHEHYRNGRNKEAIAEALKAFESTMKAICARRGWQHPKNAAASKLIDTCLQKGLIPSELASHFAGIRATLESGLPTVRNLTPGAGHGQGAAPVVVPDYLAAYALHLAATNITLLIQADRVLKQE